MLRVAAAILALGLSLSARAGEPAAGEGKPQENSSARVVHGADRVVVRKRTVVDFEDVTVEGELTKPEGSYLLQRNGARFDSLIRLRDNFNPELQKAADNL